MREVRILASLTRMHLGQGKLRFGLSRNELAGYPSTIPAAAEASVGISTLRFLHHPPPPPPPPHVPNQMEKLKGSRQTISPDFSHLEEHLLLTRA